MKPLRNQVKGGARYSLAAIVVGRQPSSRPEMLFLPKRFNSVIKSDTPVVDRQNGGRHQFDSAVRSAHPADFRFILSK